MPLIFELVAAAAIVAGPDDFTITLPVSPETPEGQLQLAARAIEICGTRYPLLTRYRFSGLERIAPDGARQSRFEVAQELTCSDSPPAPPIVHPAPAGWQPTAQDQEDARAATERYFAAVDAGDAAEVYAMWDANQQAEMSREERAAELQRFRTQAGTPGPHRIARLTWYVNPDRAPRPGIYVAADYERSYSGLLVNCGYLVWFRESGGRYALIRDETSTVAPGEAGNSPESIEQARSLSRCPPR